MYHIFRVQNIFGPSLNHISDQILSIFAICGKGQFREVLDICADFKGCFCNLDEKASETTLDFFGLINY